MREEELRSAFDVLLGPARSAQPPDVAVIRERLRRRRGRLAAVSGSAAAVVAVSGAVLAVQLTSGPGASRQVAGATVPASAPASAMPAVTTAPSQGSNGDYHATRSYLVSGPPGAVVITASLGDVQVTGGQRNSVAVTESSTYSAIAPASSHVVSGATLTLSYNCPHEKDCGLSYDVQVPAGTRVTIRDDLGNVVVTGISGPVSATASLGDITAGDLTGSAVSLDDAAGTITARDLTSASVSMTNSLGDIDASNLTSRTVLLADEDGAISAGFLNAPDSVRATDSLGDISLGLPGTASYHVTTQVTLGDATVTVPRSSSSPHQVSASADAGSVSIVTGDPGAG